MRRLAVLAVLVACRPPSLPAASDGDTAGTAASTTATAGESTTGCMNSSECETDGVCVADYMPTTGPLGGERGPPECVDMSACIGALDLARWCFDHQSCCGDLRCRTADGVCEPPDLGTSSDGDDSTTGATTTTTDPDPSTGTTTGTSTTSTTTGTSTDTSGTTGPGTSSSG